MLSKRSVLPSSEWDRGSRPSHFWQQTRQIPVFFGSTQKGTAWSSGKLISVRDDLTRYLKPTYRLATAKSIAMGRSAGVTTSSFDQRWRDLLIPCSPNSTTA